MEIFVCMKRIQVCPSSSRSIPLTQNIANFEKTIQELRIQLADSQIAVRQREYSMMETIRSLREDLRSHESAFILFRSSIFLM